MSSDVDVEEEVHVRKVFIELLKRTRRSVSQEHKLNPARNFTN